MTSTDWRALCMELADALDHNRQCLLNDRRLTHPLADKARALAVLAQPEPEVAGPTDEELYALWDAECSGGDFQGCFRFARAAIAADRARYRHQPAPPAEDVLTDKELDALMPQQMRSDLEAAVVARSADLGFDKAIGICRFSVYKKARAYARAAIAADRARYSHQPAPPAEGEVE